MSWTKINSDLYRNETGNAIIVERNSSNIPCYFFIDDLSPDIKIPLLDFFENPIYRIQSSPAELENLKNYIQSQILDLNEYKQSLYLKIIAQEKINSFSPVNLKGTISNSSLTHVDGKCHGMSFNEIPFGLSGNLQVYGLIENPLWNFTPGGNIFLNGKTLSHTIPTTGFIQKIGTAKTNNSLHLSLSEPITL